MFWPLMWPSSGWWEQEYKYNYKVSESIHSLKESHNFLLNSWLKDYNIDDRKLFYMEYSAVEWCTQTIHVENYDGDWWANTKTAQWTIPMFFLEWARKTIHTSPCWLISAFGIKFGTHWIQSRGVKLSDLMLGNLMMMRNAWIQQCINTFTYGYKKKHKSKQIYNTYTWNKFSLVTSCIVVYNVADEKTNTTLVLSQPVSSPSSPLWLHSITTALNYNNKHCTCTNHKFFFKSNSHLIYYTQTQSVRKFRYCELRV